MDGTHTLHTHGYLSSVFGRGAGEGEWVRTHSGLTSLGDSTLFYGASMT